MSTKTLTAVQKYRLANEARRKAEEEATKVAQEAFGDMAKDLFEKHPKIKSFAWAQYTPFFNDGDPCTFSAHTDCLKLATFENLESEEYESEDTGEDGFVYEECYFYGDDDKNLASSPTLFPACKDIEAFLGEFEEDLESLFGDGVQVWVSRDGVDPRDYDHD